MSEQEDQERLRAAQEKLLEDFQEAVQFVMSGRSQGLVMMTFGEGGKTLLSGDPAQILLALETAKVNLMQFHLQQMQLEQQRRSGAAYFAGPTAGSC